MDDPERIVRWSDGRGEENNLGRKDEPITKSSQILFLFHLHPAITPCPTISFCVFPSDWLREGTEGEQMKTPSQWSDGRGNR